MSEQQQAFLNRYHEAIERAQKIVAGREEHHDSVTSIPEKFLYGRPSILSLIWIKVQRLRSVIADDVEVMDDSILDLINYAAFLYAYAHTEDVSTRGHLARPSKPTEVKRRASEE